MARKTREAELSPRQKQYVESNYRRMYVSEMATNLKTTAHMVRKYMFEKDLIPKKPWAKKIHVSNITPEGCFNVRPSKALDFTWLI